ncbi:response regulator [Cohnella sp.]|uniref:response regulator transcription factor n=1 Tax=Cohnella sp. TaxID=1883426 RepID=UPI0035624F05
MIKVMIVEDEAPIQRSIKSAVESADDRFEVIATAYNGQEALMLVQELQPDIIITDIRMPVMDGLALTEKVRELYPHIQIILLSGYQEFDYARKAMLLGVVHYLLKPVSRKQIKELLETVLLDTLGKRRELHRQYVASLIHGKLLSMFPFLQQNPYKSHLLILCCAGPIPTFSFDDEIPGKVYWEDNDLQSILVDVMEGHGDFAVVNGKSISEQVIMLSFFRNQEIIRSPREWADIIADRLGSEMPISIVCSELYSDLQETAAVAQVSRSKLYKRMIFGIPLRLSISDRIGDSIAGPETDPLLKRKLTVALGQKNPEFFKIEMHRLFEKWKQMQMRQIYVEKRLKSMLQLLLHITGSRLYSSEMLEIDVNRMIMQSANYKELYRYTCGIIDFLFTLNDSENGDENDNDNERIAMKIEKHLKEHFAEQINHQMLSDIFGLVPSYLSKIFTKFKGISPAKYIIQLRIEKATELLLDPRWLTKEIAEIVGYDDPSYFSRIYKRETGLYPSEFREQNGVNLADDHMKQNH